MGGPLAKARSALFRRAAEVPDPPAAGPGRGRAGGAIERPEARAQSGDGGGAMARFFIGSATHKLDGKGRVSIPADFRDVLEAHGAKDRFVLVPAQEAGDPHLAFTVSGHERLVERLGSGEEMFASEAEERETRRRYVWSAKPIAIEHTGRFVLSKELRDRIGLTDQVLFIGDGPTFQIWEPGRFEARHQPAGEPTPAPKRLNLARMV